MRGLRSALRVAGLMAALGLPSAGQADGAQAPLFNGENALNLARKQCAFGPRSPLPQAAGGGGAVNPNMKKGNMPYWVKTACAQPGGTGVEGTLKPK